MPKTSLRSYKKQELWDTGTLEDIGNNIIPVFHYFYFKTINNEKTFDLSRLCRFKTHFSDSH